ncbi:MAG: RtcB family protein, partial [Pseudomonadota bacterium]
GSRGAIKLDKREFAAVVKQGAQWAVNRGMGHASDLEMIEDHGRIDGADHSVTSDRAFERGRDQLGTLGSGNHFVEIGFVDEIYDPATAMAWGIEKGQVTLMIHSGSRGFGYQVCDEFLTRMVKSVRQEKLDLPDKQLACTNLKSALAREYLAAMAAAANFAFANRQILMHLAREAMETSLALSPKEMGLRLLYDVCHNIAKIESHMVNGKQRKLCVHRKGATRAFPPHHPDLSERFRLTGQPVLIPGDMGRASYIMAGLPRSLEETFGSACHGAGRLLSRNEAVRRTKGRSMERELEEADVYPRSAGRKTLREEMPGAYKDVNKVVDVVHRAGIAKRTARIKPMGVLKG